MNPALATAVVAPSPTMTTAQSSASSVLRQAAATASVGAFVAVQPVRTMDTRSGLGVTRGAVRAGGTVVLQIAGRSGVPLGTSAVAVNVTVTAPTDGGFITVYPDLLRRPAVSNLNFTRNQTIPNLVVVPLGSNGKIRLFNGSTGTVQLFADVAGYYLGAPGTTPSTTAIPTAAGSFRAIAPARLVDTRSGLGVTRGTVPPSATIAVQITGRGGVPATGVSAVILNVTVTTPTANGYISAYPDLLRRPAVSNLNFTRNQTIPNLVVVPLGSNGKIRLFNGSTGTVQLFADVAGYYLGAPGTTPSTTAIPTAAGSFRAIAPARLVDTRSGLGVTRGTVPPSATIAVQITGRGGVPATGVSAVILNVTVTTPTANGYISAYPDLLRRPAVSNLNFTRNQTIPNLVVVPLGTNGRIRLFNGSNGTVQLLADVAGYYLSGAGSTPTPIPPSSPTPTPVTPTAPVTTIKWGSPQTIDALHGTPAGISCASADFCAAVDSIGNAQIFDGNRWTAPDAVDTGSAKAGGLTGVSCPSSTFCVAVDAAGNALTYNGSQWSAPVRADADQGLSAVSCPAPGSCIAVGSTGRATTLAGGDWTSTQIDAGKALVSVSCPTTDFCAAVDTAGQAVVYRGGTWTASVVNTNKNLTSVSCSSSTFCVAVDSVRAADYSTLGHAVVYDGSQWSAPVLANTNGGLTAVSCAAGNSCLATDDGGTVVTLSGNNWTPAVTQASSFTALSCATATFCAAADATGSAILFRDGTWGGPTVIDPPNAVTAVSCFSSTFCTAVDVAGRSIIFNGSNWSDPATTSSNGQLNDVSCTAAGVCTAIGLVDALTYGSDSWNGANPVASGSLITAVNCVTTLCAAVGDNGTVVVRKNGVWSAPATVDGGQTLNAVDCPATNLCIAVDTAGQAFTYDGSSWSGPRSVVTGSDNSLESVSCASTSFCVAVDAGGSAIRFDGTKWSAPQALTEVNLTSVSCPRSDFCVAVDTAGQAFVFDGASWSKPTAIAADTAFLGGLSSVSCPSATFCVAVDQSGRAVIGRS